VQTLVVSQLQTGARVIDLDPRDDPRWASFVRSHPGATAFHLPEWAEIMRRAYGYRPAYLALEEPSGELGGVLPLFLTRGVMSRKRYRVPATAMNSTGPLASSAAGEAALLNVACERTEREARLLTFQTRLAGLDELERRLVLKPKNPVWKAPVPAPEDVDIKRWKKHSRNLYRGVTRALDAGLTWREARGPEDLRRWYALYLATMRKRRTLPRSWRQIETTRRLLEPRGEFRLFVVERGDQMLAGVVTHPFNDVVELVYNGSDPGELEVRPNHLLNWGVLGWAARNGYGWLDIGEAKEGGPLARFKAQFGAEPVPEYRYDYVIGELRALAAARPAGNRAEEDPDGLAGKVWDRIPLPALRAAATAVAALA
jgi:CelD/BcsL family acetyltransferase involved in cellulose biosynthesis